MAAIQAVLPAQSAAGATAVTVVGPWVHQDGNGVGVTNLYLISPTLITGVATNNVTFNFRQLRAGAVVQTIGSVTLAAGTNLAAEVPLAVAITNQTALLDGDVVDVQMVQNGTGLAVAAGVVATVGIN